MWVGRGWVLGCGECVVSFRMFCFWVGVFVVVWGVFFVVLGLGCDCCF